MDSIINFLKTTGIAQLFEGGDAVKIVQYIAMYVIIGALFYFAAILLINRFAVKDAESAEVK